MKDINVADGIVPIGEFKSKAAKYLQDLGSQGEPLVLTQNGKPVAVMMSPAAFEELRREHAHLEAVAAGVVDADEGNLVDNRTVKSWLKSWGGKTEKPAPR